MNVLIILGHPRPGSYTEALATEYAKGALEAGVNVQWLRLGELNFELNVVVPDPETQSPEPDILRAQELIKWANHLVFAFPTWWGTMPALLKGFLDRVFVPGFAFYEIQQNEYKKLLKGRTAQLLITLDTPLWIYKIFVRAPGTSALKVATLQLCGVSPVRAKHFTPIKHSTPEKKKEWLQQSRQLGLALKNGVLTRGEIRWQKVRPWLKALRLQFYPMAWLAYFSGALAAGLYGYSLNWLVMLLGWVFIFSLEAATVFINDLHDQGTDSVNKNYSPFSGGSRVLVDGDLTIPGLKKGIRLALSVALLAALFVVLLSSGSVVSSLVVIAVLSFLAIGYTLPPFRFSYITLGEIVVSLTHSILMMLAGFIFEGGTFTNEVPWLYGLPLFFSILPSIILSGIPDREADRSAGKKTVAVRFGNNIAAYIAAFFVVLSVVLSTVLYLSGDADAYYGNAILLAIPHSIWLSILIINFIKKQQKPRHITLLMIASLTYLLWFVLVPFFRLLNS